MSTTMPSRFIPPIRTFCLVGCDGGCIARGTTPRPTNSPPICPLTQFYKVDVDYDEPFYHVVGGTQDNATQYGPAQTNTVSGIRNADWRITIGGDGHDYAIDPKDPTSFTANPRRDICDVSTAAPANRSTFVRSRPPAKRSCRFNWDSPILISPHSHTRIYFGSQKLHRSDDRGDSLEHRSVPICRGARTASRCRTWIACGVSTPFGICMR